MQSLSIHASRKINFTCVVYTYNVPFGARGGAVRRGTKLRVGRPLFDFRWCHWKNFSSI